MTFLKKIWKDKPSLDTPIVAADLNRIEDAVSAQDAAIEVLQSSVGDYVTSEELLLLLPQKIADAPDVDSNGLPPVRGDMLMEDGTDKWMRVPALVWAEDDLQVPVPRSGHYVTAPPSANSATNSVFSSSANTLDLVCFSLQRPLLISALGLMEAVAYTAMSVELGIYDSDDDGYPLNRIVATALHSASPTLDLSTAAGLKELALSVSMTLPNGRLWAATRTTAAGTIGSGTVKAGTGHQSGCPMISPVLSTADVHGGLRVTGQTSMPADLSTASFATIGNVPIVYIKAA